MVISMPGSREAALVSAAERSSKAERMCKKLHLGIVVQADLEGKEGEMAILGGVDGLLCEPTAVLPRRAAPLPRVAAGARHGGGSPAEGMDARAVAAVALLAAQCVAS